MGPKGRSLPRVCSGIEWFSGIPDQRLWVSGLKQLLVDCSVAHRFHRSFKNFQDQCASQNIPETCRHHLRLAFQKHQTSSFNHGPMESTPDNLSFISVNQSMLIPTKSQCNFFVFHIARRLRDVSRSFPFLALKLRSMRRRCPCDW